MKKGQPAPSSQRRLFFVTVLSLSLGSLPALGQKSKSSKRSPSQSSEKPGANSPTTPPSDGSIAPSSGPNGGESEVPSSDKLDLGNLEQKYWSAKDDDFTVVQNRTYSKNKRFFLSAMTGRIVNDGFFEGSPNAFSLGYFFNERHGLSLDRTSFSTAYNAVVNAYVTEHGSIPAHNRPISTTSLTYLWSPIYAKVSLLEKKILYLDMNLGLHFGTTEYHNMTEAGGQPRSSQHYGLSVSQLWFVSKNIALRFDYRSNWSRQDEVKFRSTDPGTRSLGVSTLQDNMMLLGVNVFFGR